MKPKILVVVDIPGWALDRTASNVIKCLSDHFAFEKIFNNEAATRIPQGGFDLLYLAYWKQFIDAQIDIDFPGPCISGIRSHFKWDNG